MSNDQPVAPLTISLMLDAETPFPGAADMMITIISNAGFSRVVWGRTPTMQLTLPFHNGPGDDYNLTVHVAGYRDGLGFFKADPHTHPTVSILMVPGRAVPVFPTWAELKASDPAAAGLIAATVSETEAEARYTALGNERPLALASLLNLCAAMNDIGLGDQKTPLSFIRQIIWDDTLAQDRFFGYADPAIIPLVQAAAAEGEFAEEPNPGVFHNGATLSYKQTQFAYSNVQLTFHQDNTLNIGGVDCVMIEPDMDLYKELVAHGLGEVLPNWITKDLTDPLAVLALRWIDAVRSNGPPFDPGYTLS